VLYEKIAGLRLQIDDIRLEPLELNTAAGWTRRTTVIRLEGNGVEGLGEDVTYDGDVQMAFSKQGSLPGLAGTFSFEEFSRRLDRIELSPRGHESPVDRLYRRWGLESAALDLALRQAGTSLATVLEREPCPVSFVISLGLGEPPSVQPLERVLKLYPWARFKVDLSEGWNEAFIGYLAGTGVVSTVDLKGQYRGIFQGPPANATQYRLIAESLPDVWIEDPDLNDATRVALEPFQERITWDAIIHSVADIVQLPVVPRCINMKPSRFGFVSELLRAYEYCEDQGIAMYGGGQFELGAGRGQIQYLASLFHPEGPNDVAPSPFNEAGPPPGLPGSPLAPAVAPVGFALATSGSDA
jgi:hypothetical protein